ncbi:pleiotropic drug resistance ABC transporter [Mycena sanguinolenta]|nr:pleiotropic drug resistance ABC transporter [Mycena sanguinolenta]
MANYPPSAWTTPVRTRRRPRSEPLVTLSPEALAPTQSAPSNSNWRSSVYVSLDYFDPAGVQELPWAVSRLSERRRQRQSRSRQSVQLESIPAVELDATLKPGDGPFDFERTLRFIRRKMEEAHIEGRELGIVFQNLRVVGLGASISYQPTLGSILNPNFILEKIMTLRNPPLRTILGGFSGVVRPGEMLLVLGRPGSGCSTLLKTLANQTDEYHSVSGSVRYDALSPEDIRAHYRGDVLYCPEDDVHFPTLTVEQTLRFAARLRAPQADARFQSRDEYVDSMVEILLTIFGLRHVRQTQVGDNAIRGVSGGQKKRVSIAEALATRARISAWDNSTRGLDASTALEFGRALRIATDVARLTTIVSLYQASESLYALFDKVCVVSEGRMVYFGRTDQAREYFLSLGYVPQAERQTTPDFLVSVMDPLGRVVHPSLPIHDRARPRTSDEFAKHFLASPLMEQNLEDIADYIQECDLNKDRAQQYQRSARAEHAKGTRRSSPYTTSLVMQAHALILRRFQIIMGFLTPTVINVISFVVQGVITGSVFVNSPESTSAFFSRGGVMFFAILFSVLTSTAEIVELFKQRQITLRLVQARAALYHPFIEAVALTLVDIPITFGTTTIFAIILYFMVGLQRTAAQFFIFCLFVFTTAITMKAFFRAIAAAFTSPAVAQAFAGLMTLLLILYTGYTIPKSSRTGALRWITYINPLRYGFEGIMSNEFHTLKGSCASLVPRGPGYENVTLANQVCATVGAVAGQTFVDGNSFIAESYGYSIKNQWLNVGLVIAFAGVFLVALFVFTEFNTSSSTDTSVVLFKRGSKTATGLVAVDINYEDVDKKLGAATRSPVYLAQIKDPAPTVARPVKDIFSWKNLTYTVPVKDGTRTLLDNVSGYVSPGTITALMGESGAGKTTLLNVLAERTKSGAVHGDIFVNGHPMPPDFRSQTGYVEQLDTHAPMDTVREALLFSATLRQPASVPLAEKIAYVEKCLKMCGLEAVADASVGTLGVEHRKRTTIGVELAAKPKMLLFLDEASLSYLALLPLTTLLSQPTSGLDSQSAWAIMQFLKQLAANGQAILCTCLITLKPSAELFEMFDRLLLLRKGGQVVYFGNIGQDSNTLIQYFEANGSRSCDPSENPAEYMLDVIGAGSTASSGQDWVAVWRGSPESARTREELDKIHAHGQSRGALRATSTATFAAPWAQQTTSLLRRDFLARWRNPTYLIAKLVLNICSGLFMGFTFYKSENSQQGTQNKLFAIFMTTIMASPLSNQLQVLFLEMRKIYEIREGPTMIYSWTALITSQLLSEIPWNIMGSSLFFLCWYWTVGFDAFRAPYTYLASFSVSQCISQSHVLQMLGVIFPLWYTSLGQAVAAMSPTTEIAGVLFGFLFSFVCIFAGILQPAKELKWWKWMYRVSPFTYLIEVLLGQAVGKHDITCSAVELVRVDPPAGQTCGAYLASYISFAGGYLTNPNAVSACEFCSTATTDQLLGSGSNIFYSHRWRNVWLMLAYVGFNIISIYTLMWCFRIRTTNIFAIFKKRKTLG